MPAEGIVETMCEQVMAAAGKERALAAVGVGVPGPGAQRRGGGGSNLPQLKGARLAEMLAAQLRGAGDRRAGERSSTTRMDLPRGLRRRLASWTA